MQQRQILLLVASSIAVIGLLGFMFYNGVVKVAKEEQVKEELSEGGGILFGEEARSFCGAEPPAMCSGGTRLGCGREDRKWNCFSVVEIDTSSPGLSEVEGWKTYRNEEYGFEVRYPPDVVTRKRSTAEEPIFWDGKLDDIPYIISFNYISQDTFNRMGITYCGAYPEDARCESFKWDGLAAGIDWGIELEGTLVARAEIQHSDGGQVIISFYHRPIQVVRPFFRQILSTFKFVEIKDGAGNDNNVLIKEKEFEEKVRLVMPEDVADTFIAEIKAEREDSQYIESLIVMIQLLDDLIAAIENPENTATTPE